jgi:hypothetical protein
MTNLRPLGGARRPFAAGEEEGGPVLFEEPRGDFRWRRNRVYSAVWLIMAMASVALPISYFIPASGPWSPLQVMAVLIGSLGALAVVGVIVERPKYANVSPFRIYQNGISTGFGDLPYVAFESVYAVENRRSAKRQVRFTVIAFVDGTEATVSEGGLSDPIVMLRSDYDAFAETLFARARGVMAERLAWDEDARQFMEGLPWFHGPAMARTEMVARERGVGRISMEFISDHRKEIGDSKVVGMAYFRHEAEKRFGSPENSRGVSGG